MSFFVLGKSKRNDILDIPELGGDGKESSRIEFIQSINSSEKFHGLRFVNVNHARKRNFKTKTIVPKFKARIRDAVLIGETVEFKYRGFWHKAVTTGVTIDRDCVSSLTVTVVHYGEDKTVYEEPFTFDLRHDDIYLHPLHSVHFLVEKKVFQRARSRIGQRRYNLLNHRSSHLPEEVVTKSKNEHAVYIIDIKPGDVINFNYRSLKHDAEGHSDKFQKY